MPRAVATELTDHITDPGVRESTEKFYGEVAIAADDIAEIIAFAVSRPRRVNLNEILVRPTSRRGEDISRPRSASGAKLTLGQLVASEGMRAWKQRFVSGSVTG
jgi:hypothetical protein